jgi:hypothetical protein
MIVRRLNWPTTLVTIHGIHAGVHGYMVTVYMDVSDIRNKFKCVFCGDSLTCNRLVVFSGT